MRRTDRQITDKETLDILQNGEYGIMSTITPLNEPYGVPLNYCVIGENIYFHCALLGEKIDSIVLNPKVSFCVVGKTEVLPEQFAMKYESCIVGGIAKEVFEEEKQAALEQLLHKYSEDFIPEGLKYRDSLNTKTRVFKISIQTISGKARR